MYLTEMRDLRARQKELPQYFKAFSISPIAIGLDFLVLLGQAKRTMKKMFDLYKYILQRSKHFLLPRYDGAVVIARDQAADLAFILLALKSMQNASGLLYAISVR